MFLRDNSATSIQVLLHECSNQGITTKPGGSFHADKLKLTPLIIPLSGPHNAVQVITQKRSKVAGKQSVPRLRRCYQTAGHQ